MDERELAESEGEEYFSELVAGGKDLCLVAESGGMAVGYLVGRLREGASVRPGRSAELESMFVLAEHRNDRIGAHLVADFLRWAWAEDAGRASVTAYAANEGAIRFYRRHGFEPSSVSLEMRVPTRQRPAV